MTDDWDISDQVSIPIGADESGFTGREYPSKDCEGHPGWMLPIPRLEEWLGNQGVP